MLRGTSYLLLFFFFFSSRRRHTRLQGDWSSDVCSSDLQRWRSSTSYPATSWPDCSVTCRRRLRASTMRRRSEEHTSELQSPCNLVCRLLLEKKKKIICTSSCRSTLPS